MISWATAPSPCLQKIFISIVKSEIWPMVHLSAFLITSDGEREAGQSDASMFPDQLLTTRA